MLIAFLFFIDFQNFPCLLLESFVFLKTNPNNNQKDKYEQDNDGGGYTKILAFTIKLILEIEHQFLPYFTR